MRKEHFIDMVQRAQASAGDAKESARQLEAWAHQSRVRPARPAPELITLKANRPSMAGGMHEVKSDDQRN